MAQSLLDQLIDDTYQVERLLGEGGMGVVVAAFDLRTGAHVAIKLLAEDADEVMARRFVREARAAAQIESSHVAHVFDVGLHGNRPYMVMELLEGRDLDALLRLQGPQSSERAAAFALHACEALAEAHAHGIIHRDIKPANLFLVERDGSAVVKLLDFGISKFALSKVSMGALTNTDVVLGTPSYTPPEQLKDSRNVDPRADIWSLGATLYELVSGRPPFVERTIPELCAAILREDPPAFDPALGVSPRLDKIIRRCLEKELSRRYQNVRELAHDLARVAPASKRTSALRVEKIFAAEAVTRRGEELAAQVSIGDADESIQLDLTLPADDDLEEASAMVAAAVARRQNNAFRAGGTEILDELQPETTRMDGPRPEHHRDVTDPMLGGAPSPAGRGVRRESGEARTQIHPGRMGGPAWMSTQPMLIDKSLEKPLEKPEPSRPQPSESLSEPPMQSSRGLWLVAAFAILFLGVGVVMLIDALK